MKNKYKQGNINVTEVTLKGFHTLGFKGNASINGAYYPVISGTFDGPSVDVFQPIDPDAEQCFEDELKKLLRDYINGPSAFAEVWEEMAEKIKEHQFHLEY
ncbi:hypothetical protein FC84_GL001665 [Lapidilactobacillus dextrinicus DSM 20335]|uniref:Uncharacterized protein n=1 Tax=Lapidilactobacillus dextrinicus DSM 20335 TaxID=1423738 RepID=A0A0R2BIY0_9LACO|nr:hypothetical protein [Lapidilactobacillus dextrinicus]KRM79485.1 hypothetical protein FC84_GL001665 [Lapidilactobacillus dextrinicus DSM 20335]QFG46681.1 hypothetical protein LH506_04130 [Lapidilactobacillus dextrinicus]